MRARTHLGNGSGQREERLLFEKFFIDGGQVGLHMELVGLALCSLRLPQAEVMIRPPVVGDAAHSSFQVRRRTS